jgi:hypothetical protein
VTARKGSTSMPRETTRQCEVRGQNVTRRGDFVPGAGRTVTRSANQISDAIATAQRRGRLRDEAVAFGVFDKVALAFDAAKRRATELLFSVTPGTSISKWNGEYFRFSLERQITWGVKDADGKWQRDGATLVAEWQAELRATRQS